MTVYRENALQYDDYIRLRESVGWNNCPEEQVRPALKHGCFDVIALEDRHVVGMGRLLGDGLYYTVVDVVVEPAYQGRGIGTELLNRLLAYAGRSTPAGGRTSVQLIAEKGLEPYYESRGFKAIPHAYCGSGMRNVIHM